LQGAMRRAGEQGRKKPACAKCTRFADECSAVRFNV